jgi:antitoxin MazE
MVKKLAAHGNSAALVIDKPIMELLHITMETPLEISTDGKNLIVSPVTDPAREKKFKAALGRVISKHGKTFVKLAR